MFLPDFSQSEVSRALHLLYTRGDTRPLDHILGNLSHLNMEDNPQEAQRDPDHGDHLDDWDSSHGDEDVDSEDDSVESEDDDSMAVDYKLKQSSKFLTSTECKRSPIKSIGRESVEGLGLCFVSPISKDYEERPGDQEVNNISISSPANWNVQIYIWFQDLSGSYDNFIKTNLRTTVDSGEEDDSDEDLGTSLLLTSRDVLCPPLLQDLVDKTKTASLTDLTNVEFWIKHFDAIIIEHYMKESGNDGSEPTELSASLILKFLEIMNEHFLKMFPSTIPGIQKKNCFPRLADILIKRLPIIFGDYLNTKDIEKFSFEQHNMNTEMEEIEEYPPELMSQPRWQPQAQILVERLRDQNHGRHRVEVRAGEAPLILCDGFTFRPKSLRLNHFKCIYKSCRAFIKIREGKWRYPSKSMHFNHPKKWKALKRISRLEDIWRN